MKVGDKIKTIKKTNVNGFTVPKGTVGFITLIPEWRQDIIQVKTTDGFIVMLFRTEVGPA